MIRLRLKKNREEYIFISFFFLTNSLESRGKGFIVLFTKSIIQSTNNVYITSENGVQMNMSTSPHLDASIKSQIDRSVNIPSSQHIILPSELELQS